MFDTTYSNDLDLFDLKQPSPKQIKMLNLVGNFEVNEKLLNSLSSNFNQLTKVKDDKTMLSDLKSDLSMSSLDDDIDWLDEQHLSLKQLSGTKITVQGSNMPKMLSLQLSEFNNVLPPSTFKSQLLQIVVDEFRRRVVPVNVWVNAFKNLSISMKKSDNPRFQDFTDIELFVGYNLGVGLSHERKVSKVVDWGVGDISRGKYQDLYYDAFNKQLASNDHFTNPFNDSRTANISLERFLMRVNLWMTDGSSRGMKVELTSQGERITSLAKKQALALGLNLEQLKEMCLVNNPDWDYYSATEKIEPGRKGRLIISAPLSLQMKMSYIEYCLGSLFSDSYGEINFLKNARNQFRNVSKLTNYTNFSNKWWLLQKGTHYFFPADATAFDQFVSRGEIELIFKYIRVAVMVRVDAGVIHQDCIEVMDAIIQTYFDIPVKVGDEVVGHWQHGVPSGIRWTTLLDSLINIVRFKTMVNLSSGDPIFGRINVPFITVQGDDMAMVMNRTIDSLRLLKMYELFNIPIHPYKNFISHTKMEFLRKIHVKGTQLAYPNRLITKFLFRLPENRGANDIRTLLQERTTSLVRLYSRFDNTKYPERIMKMVAYVLEIDVSLATKIVTSPSFLGGFGLLPSYSQIKLKGHHLADLFLWQPVRDIDADINLTGVYLQAVEHFSRALGLPVLTTNLKAGLLQALNPQRLPFQHTRFLHKKAEINTKFSINTKIMVDLFGKAYYKTWAVSRTLDIINLSDVVAHFRRTDNLDGLLNITDDSCHFFTTMMFDHCTTKLAWDWVEGKTPTLSFVHVGLNDVQRSLLSEYVFGTLFYKVLISHRHIGDGLFNSVLFLSWCYLQQNVDFLLSNNILTYCID